MDARTLLATLLSMLVAHGAAAHAADQLASVRRLNPTTAEVVRADGGRMVVDFYGENIFRLFLDPVGGPVADPEAEPEARILVDSPRRPAGPLSIGDDGATASIATRSVALRLDKRSGAMDVTDLRSGKRVMEGVVATASPDADATVTLRAADDEWFYGGGVQNGRFSHRGKVVAIENQNSWTDGGVASPTPFYWSTAGYGLMWHTFRPGRYDFGASEAGVVRLSHSTPTLDLFCMVDADAAALLADFYQLTGAPVLIPKFGFYEGHLNAYNRDYWTETDEGGILFEDGRRWRESQRDNGGTRESLNGEEGNYQFSARAVVDRYRRHDMPLGWLLPNDGYGAGYGQAETLEGNIENLRLLGDYARRHGVEIGLWTQSDLHPKEGVEALLQRDIVREVRDAGIRVLKTDVAWVGAGYSFGLNGVADVGAVMPYYGDDARPFIITLDGWAGTQRYAGVWTGDQTGGQWEYIRFHVPTYIGAGLSGQPNICSDMDGIFGGKDPVVNTRDFQWKTFTPMQLNMDGWGANEKYPHAMGEPATSINRMWLKLKSELLPYAYHYAREATDGLPLVRAMMLDTPNDYTRGVGTQYQFLFGRDILVAPIYKETRPDGRGGDIRDGIYLPPGRWVDYFSGETYEGDRILNSFAAPLWKTPVFVRMGAIVPMAPPNNNVGEAAPDLRIFELWPQGTSRMDVYDDDGRSEAYRRGEATRTRVETTVDAGGRLTVGIAPTTGGYDGFARRKRSELRINVTAPPKRVSAKVGGRKVKLTKAATAEEFAAAENAYWYEARPNLNRHATRGSEFAGVEIVKNPVLHVKLAATDIAANATEVTIEGYSFAPEDKTRVKTGALETPRGLAVTEENREAYTLRPTWGEVANADYYEMEHQGMLYTGIRSTTLELENLHAETRYGLRVRAVNKDGASAWSAIEVTTKANPLEFAIEGIAGECSHRAQPGFGLRKLLDFSDSGETWHTRYGERAVPFSLTLDLHTVNQLDKMHYLPRVDAGNGTFLAGKVSVSADRHNWTEAGEFRWGRDASTKEFTFAGRPAARYVKIDVTEAVGGYGAGREIYVFRIAGTSGHLQGDINDDGVIDGNDLTSYMNYTGLRRGDADFDYAGRGDINQNGLIDALDISTVATRMEGGAKPGGGELGGTITAETTPRGALAAGETVEVRIVGTGMSGVNAVSMAVGYDPAELEYVGTEATGMKEMEDMTRDRLHTDGSRSVYPTFVNIGDKATLEGTGHLLTVRFRTRRKTTAAPRVSDVIIVGKDLDFKTQQ